MESTIAAGAAAVGMQWSGQIAAFLEEKVEGTKEVVINLINKVRSFVKTMGETIGKHLGELKNWIGQAQLLTKAKSFSQNTWQRLRAWLMAIVDRIRSIFAKQA